MPLKTVHCRAIDPNMSQFDMDKREKKKIKIFATSDIHGCRRLLEKALKRAGFDPQDPNHILLVLGDLFDRGDDNKGTLDFLDSLKNKLLLRGNHELILIKALRSGVVTSLQEANGTIETIRQFFPLYDGGRYFMAESDVERKTKERLFELVDRMPYYFETDNYIFTHGWLPADSRRVRDGWRRATPYVWNNALWLRWYDYYGNCSVPDGKTIVIGHTPTRYAADFDPSRSYSCYAPFYGKGLIAIDGGAVYSGNLNVVCIEDTVDMPIELDIPLSHELYLDFLKNRDKKVELSLNVGKIAQLRPGDRLVYRDVSSSASFTVRVISIHSYSDFGELYEDFMPYELGFEGSSADFVATLRKIYHYEEVADHGVVAVVFARVP